MEEFNKDILQKAISKLPGYKAPSFIWENIEDVLVADEQDALIAATVPELPTFQAPESAWTGIETALDHTHSSAKQYPTIIRLGRLAVAASLIGFVAWVGWNQFYGDQEKYTLVYSEEQVSQFDYELEVEDDENSFTAMLTHFKTSVVAKQHEDYEILLDEYTELKSATDELKEMMESYGKDPELIQQFSEIEHERSRVIKKMAALI